MKNFIKKLAGLNLFLKEKEGDLILSGHKGKLTKEDIEKIKKEKSIINFIKENKVDLIAFLNSEEARNTKKSKKEKISAIYELSPLQEGMLFHYMYDESSVVYCEQLILDFPKGLNIEAFKASWNFVIRQHSVLRTSFIYDKISVPVQYTVDNVEMPFEMLDYSNMAKKDCEQELEVFLKADLEKGFDFEKPPLMRITLIKTGEDAYTMIWTYHHILIDGWSFSILLGELLRAYGAFAEGQKPPELIKDNYKDYIDYINSINKQEEENFWKKYMHGFEQATLLPFINKQHRDKGESNVKKIYLELDKDFTKRVKSYSQNRYLTVNTIMQGVWSLLLSRYTNQKNVVFGVAVSGRPIELERVESRVGLYINTLPFHADVDSEQAIDYWLTTLQKDHTEARKYQFVSLSQIQKWSKITGVFFDSILVFENYPIEDVLADKAVLKTENIRVKEENNFPLSIEVIDFNEKISIGFSYKGQLLNTENIQRIKGNFYQVLCQIIDGSAIKLKEINILVQEERNQLLLEFNDTFADYPKSKTLINLIEEQVNRTPDSVALVFEKQQLTYRELNERSNQLANYLRKKGVIEETLVAVCVDRSLEMMVGLIGIIKSGGAYVPIDSEHPQERINYVIDNAEANFVICTKNYASLFHDKEEINTIFIDEDWPLIAQELIQQPTTDLTSDNLMYVIYTSGSTGKPKGVMNQHSGVVNRLLWTQEEFQLVSGEDVILQKTTYCFDVSVWELFWPLISGVTLVLARPGGHKDNDYLKEVIEENQITTIHFVPSMLEVFLPEVTSTDCKSLKRVLCSGEALKPSHVSEFRKRLAHVELYNLYGPTEAAVDVTYWKVPPIGVAVNSVPIGKPISNTQLYILDFQGQVCPIGVPGELNIAGIQVARGYRNREDLTKEKFVKDPFNQDPFAKMYKTGDLVYWLPDGNIQYLGRMDSQVKIRGLRIELGEIEAVLQELETVNQCVVLVLPDHLGNKRLVAYIVSENNYDKSAIQKSLKAKLPEYMIPSIIVQIEEIPLLPNGKINRRALPNPDASSLITNDYVAAENEVQEQLVQIWKDLLKIEKIGIQDDFFALGGNSLIAIRMISAIRSKINVRNSVRDIFNYPTIKALAALIEKGKENKQKVLPKIIAKDRSARIPLSFAQERLWFINQLEGSIQYHVPTHFKIRGNLEKKLLEHSFKILIDRHEILRTLIYEENGVAYQKIMDVNAWKMNFEKHHFSSAAEEQNYVETLMTLPFNLTNDLPLRVTLLEVNPEEYIVVIVIHHLASDGWSGSILFSELTTILHELMKGEPISLMPLKVQYADFAIWQRQYLTEENLSKQLAYWVKQLRGVEPLKLLTDFVRPAIQSTNGAYCTTQIDLYLLQKINTLAKREGLTNFMVILASLKVLLYKYCGQEDICVGVPVTGRTEKEIEPLIGLFVNTLCLRNQLNGNPVFTDFLQTVKQNVLDAYDAQAVPFEQVVGVLGLERNRSQSPIFQLVFNYFNMPERSIVDIEGIEIELEHSEVELSKVDLKISVMEKEDGLNIEVLYCSDLYKSSTIEQLLKYFKNILEEIVDQPHKRLDDLQLLKPEEKEELLCQRKKNHAEYPVGESMISLFEKQVQTLPDHTALIFESEEISYKDLNEKANQIAHLLYYKGVQKGDMINICIDRSVDMIVGILGILKVGGVYVPIDPTFPLQHIEYLLEDTQANVILTSDQYAEQFSDSQIELVVNMDTCLQTFKTSVERLPITVAPQDSAYMIYTSGSTGRPKGVIVSHGAVVNGLNQLAKVVQLQSEDRVLQCLNYIFDASIQQIFTTLMHGATLVLVKKEALLDTRLMEQVLTEKKISHFSITASLLQNIKVNAYPGLKRILVGGETCPVDLAKAWIPYVDFYNIYGPTETAIIASIYHYDKIAMTKYPYAIPIGKPLGNIEFYILDTVGNLLPKGSVGELYIGGKCLAEGYHNRKELTKEKFVASPFAPGEMLYKTGDLACWLSDGNALFKGRIDHQVKIRGQRIELKEVEEVMRQTGIINQVIVDVKTSNTDQKYLVAYIVVKEGQKLRDMKEQLEKLLPSYMIPSFYIEMENLPLNPNGKVNRAALPVPDFSSDLLEIYVAPRDELETRMEKVWCEFLQQEQVGIHHNFFKLGGHSLMAMKLIAKIAKDCDVNIAVADLFRNPTIAGLAEIAKNRTFKKMESIISETDEESISKESGIMIEDDF